MSYRKSGIIDTRDLHERLEELRGLRDQLEQAEEESETLANDVGVTGDVIKNLEYLRDQFSDDEKKELAELESLSEEISEWQHGEALIPEDEFVEYCQQLLEDIGDLPKDLPGYIAIDWDKTADNLRADYSEVEYQGTTYLVRS